MENYRCKICGGDLVLKIGAVTAFCDHCGSAVSVDPKDAKKYADVYWDAQRLMRTDTLAGYSYALTRLQSIAFIPQAREQAAVCEQRIAQLNDAHAGKRSKKDSDDGKNTVFGVIITVICVLLLAAILTGVGFAVYHLWKGDMSPTAMIVMIAAAVAFAVVLIVGKLQAGQ